MRLIMNQAVLDSMMDNYRTVEIIQVLRECALSDKNFLRNKYMPLLNADDFGNFVNSTSRIINPPEIVYLRKADPYLINICLIPAYRIQAIRGTLVTRMRRLN